MQTTVRIQVVCGIICSANFCNLTFLYPSELVGYFEPRKDQRSAPHHIRQKGSLSPIKFRVVGENFGREAPKIKRRRCRFRNFLRVPLIIVS